MRRLAKDGPGPADQPRPDRHSRDGRVSRAPPDQAPAHAPVVQGLVGRALGLTPEEAEAGAFHGLLAGFSAAAVRLGKIGAISAQELVTQAIAHHAPSFEVAPDAPSAFAPIADIAAQRRDAAAVNLFAT
ncbi:MAG: urease accessory UreF family protein [Pseudomonadota bacterium]